MSSEPVVYEAYAVVCKDLHLCLGPYPRLPEAIEIARARTAEGPCVYVPVKLLLNSDVVQLPGATPEAGSQAATAESHPGTYL